MSLGMVLAPYGQVPGSFPYEIGYSYGGDGTFMCPDDDKLYQTRGEMGHYYDTQLGATMPEYSIVATLIALLPKARANRGLVSKVRQSAAVRKQLGSSIPSDHALYQTYGYIPQMSGWVHSKAGYSQTPWLPPNGWRPEPLHGASLKCANGKCLGLGDITPDTAAVLDAINQQNAKMFTLSLLTTVAVGVSAVIAVIRNYKAIKHAVL